MIPKQKRGYINASETVAHPSILKPAAHSFPIFFKGWFRHDSHPAYVRITNTNRQEYTRTLTNNHFRRLPILFYFVNFLAISSNFSCNSTCLSTLFNFKLNAILSPTVLQESQSPFCYLPSIDRTRRNG